MKQAVLSLISLYQRTRIFRPVQCRFYPSCSTYAVQAIDRHGLLNGFLLAAWRLLRCQPLHPGGVEEVPEHFAEAFRPGCECSRAVVKRGVMPMPAATNAAPGLYNYGN